MTARVALAYKTPIETGGTNSLTGLRTGGQLVSLDGSESHPLPITSTGVVYTAYFIMLDDTDNDPGIDSTEHIAFDPPAGLQVCQTYDGTFVDQLETTLHVMGAYQPIYLKLNNQVDDADGYDLPYGALSGGSITSINPTAGDRPSQVTGVSAASGNASVTISFSDIALQTHGSYEIDRATDSGFTTELTHFTNIADDSTSYINNAAHGNAPSNDTTYYYHIRGVDNRGVGPWSDTVNATPTAPQTLWSFNEENGTVADSSNFDTWINGTATIATDGNGYLVNTSNGTGNWGMVTFRTPISGTQTYKLPTKWNVSGSATYYSLLEVCNVVPGYSPGFWDGYSGYQNKLTLSLNSGTTYCTFTNTSGSTRWLNSTGSANYASSTGTGVSLSSNTLYQIILDVTATTVRIRIMNQTETTTYRDSGTLNWSGIMGTTDNIYLRFGNPAYNITGTVSTDYFQVI